VEQADASLELRFFEAAMQLLEAEAAPGAALQFAAVTIVFGVIVLASALLPMSIERRYAVPRAWAHTLLWLLKTICRLDYVVEGRDGRFGPPEDVSATSRPGERVHFAFHPGGGDWLAWFHKVRGLPLHVYARGGRPGAWSAVDELSAGYGGYHYDPFLAMAPNGTLAAVWGWDGGDSAELVYSVRRDARWSAPMRAAALDDGKPELPSMDVDAAGRFHVVWANGVRGRTRVWYTTIDP
jgi:hypothetical protein